MILLRLVFATAFLISLPFGLCGGGDAEVADQLKALKLTMASIGDDPNNVPPIGQAYDCAITIRRQPTPPASPLDPVRGSCLWDVEKQGSLWLVTFRETWLCKEWSASVSGFPACPEPTGFHEWQYQVVVTSGSVEEVSSTGAFAPDM